MTDEPSISPYLRENFRQQPFWNPTKILPHEMGKEIHRMDLNECPFPPSDKVVQAIAEAASGLNRYPDGTCPELTARLSEKLGVGEERICYGSGSTQLLTCIAEISVGPGENLVAPEVIWRRFSGVFQATAADVTAVPNLPDGAIDVDGLLAAVGNNTKMVLALSPNNPTGLMLTEEQIRKLSDNVPENVLLFLDEAYYEFAVYAGGADGLQILKDRKGPWVVTRTFSKAYALAGLRLGYAICSSEEIANALRLVSSTFNVNGIAEAAVLAALEDADYTQMILQENEREMSRIKDACRELGLTYMDSATNFISIDVGRSGKDVVAQMRERGIRITTPGYDGVPNHIRVSMGQAADTEAFLAALREILAD